MLTLAACAFCLSSKVAKMLVGTLRCGSGMTGLGGVCVEPVVICARASTPDWMSRAFGAGFGIGTPCCAITGTAWAIMATPTANAQTLAARGMIVDAVIRDFRLLFNAQS